MRHIWQIKGLIDGPFVKRDVFFSTADIGWITGHSYLTYAPFALGIIPIMYEGAPSYPHDLKVCEIIDRFKVTHFYTAPTFIRSLIGKVEEKLSSYSLDSLKVLGSVGEPLNIEAWNWYYSNIGKKQCPIVDTYWQTETGGYLIAPIADQTPLKPGSCTLPFFTIEPEIFDGSLCIKHSWPGIAKTIFNDHKRFQENYLKKFPGYYFTGDEAKMDPDGYYWILGRLDDVIKVSGHRLSSCEIEKVLLTHPSIVEAALVSAFDPIKTHEIFAFIVLKNGSILSQKEVQEFIKKEHSSIAIPKEVFFVEELPKTRSGKILRRILSDLLNGKKSSDTSSLANGESLDKIQDILAKRGYFSSK